MDMSVYFAELYVLLPIYYVQKYCDANMRPDGVKVAEDSYTLKSYLIILGKIFKKRMILN